MTGAFTGAGLGQLALDGSAAPFVLLQSGSSFSWPSAVIAFSLVLVATGVWGRFVALSNGVNPWVGFLLGLCLFYIGIRLIPFFRPDRLIYRPGDTTKLPPGVSRRVLGPQTATQRELEIRGMGGEPASGVMQGGDHLGSSPFYNPGSTDVPEPAAPRITTKVDNTPAADPRVDTSRVDVGSDVIPPPPPTGLRPEEDGFFICPNCGTRTKAGRRRCMGCGMGLPEAKA